MVTVASVPAAAVPVRGLSDHVIALLRRIDYRRADALEEKEAIFKLRYAAYLREGAIPPNASERFCDALDNTDNAWTFGIYVEGELVSSIRLHVATRQLPKLPALGVFSDLFSPTLAAGWTIVDPTRFVIDRTTSRRYPQLCYVTTRLAWLASEYFNTHLLLATVRAEHQAFYQRVFGHRLICEPRHYPSLIKPICLMALDYRLACQRVVQRYPFFRSTVAERRALFERKHVLPQRSVA
jgi:Autoinducer synthase